MKNVENKGWITLHRKIQQWEWYDDTPTRSIFIDLLLSASYNEYQWHGVTIKRGQVPFGRLEASRRLGLSEQSIRTAIKKLKSTNEITTSSTNRYTLITIVNYDKYQCDEGEDNQQSNQQSNIQSTSNQPAINQQLTTTNKVNKDNKVNKVNNSDILTHEKSLDFIHHVRKPLILAEEKLFAEDLEEVKGGIWGIVEHYNAVFGKNVSSIVGFEKNYDFWANEYSDDQIKAAITNAYSDKWWKNKLTLTKLFRRKNTNQENVDYIGDLSERETKMNAVIV